LDHVLTLISEVSVWTYFFNPKDGGILLLEMSEPVYSAAGWHNVGNNLNGMKI
jgi:hypothetical protein